jgi:hypothetical protein
MIGYSKTGDGERRASDEHEPEPYVRAGAAEGPAGQDPLATLRRALAELQDYVAYYLAARADALKLQVRTILIYVALGLVAGLAGAGALITAMVLTLNGVANGLALLLGGHIWAGQLIAGLGVLILAAVTIVFGLRYLTNSSRGRTMKKYEHWRTDQRAQFGHDVVQRAANSEPRS